VKVIKDFIRKMPVCYLCFKDDTKIVRHAVAPGALNPYLVVPLLFVSNQDPL
jgi:hypothetical protein